MLLSPSHRIFAACITFFILLTCIANAATAAQPLSSFALRIFGELSHEPNVFISPPSIFTALLLAALGATPGSNNERQLESVLGGPASDIANSLPAPSTATSHVTLQLANSVWLSSSILPKYRKLVQNAVASSVFPLPATAKPVNAWVRNATHGEITRLIETVPADVRALLVSVVYFKGLWTSPFNPRDTIDAPFFVADNSSKDAQSIVRMMTLRRKYFNMGHVTLAPNRGLKLIDLPYGNDTYVATIVLPDSHASMDNVLRLLRSDVAVATWSGWLNRMVVRKVSLLQVPKFRMEYGVKSLQTVLQTMGITDAFNGSILNQFSAMSRDPRIFVSDVLHKAAIEVTEEGATASGATGAIIMTRSARLDVSFVANRPFLLFIRNRVTGVILFAGRIDSPGFGVDAGKVERRDDIDSTGAGRSERIRM